MHQHQVDHLPHFGTFRATASQRELVFNPVQSHEDSVSQVNVVFPFVVREMACCRHAILMRLLDQNLHFARRRLLDLDTADTLLSPLVHLLTNFRFRDVIWPPDAIVRRGLNIVLAAKGAEVRTGCEQAWPGRFTRIDQVALCDDALGVIFAGGPCRRHAVSKEYNPVVDDFFHPPVVDEVEIVMGMQIDQSRKDRVGILQLYDVGNARVLACVDVDNFAVLNDDATVATARIAYAVEQPATTNNEVSAPCCRPLSMNRKRCKQHRKE